MKHIKKVFAFALTIVMAFALALPAFADGTDGTITVDNAAVGKEYVAYKILDATYDGDAISYSTTTPSIFASSPFTVSDQADSDGNYGVKIAESVTVGQINTWITENINNFTAIPAAKGVDDGNLATETTVKWTGLAYGYYYVTSGLGSEVTITSVAKDAAVKDKNTTNPKDLVKEVDEASAKIGDPVNFTVTLTATNFITTNSEDEQTGEVTATTDKVTKYIVADTADGFDYVIDDTHVVTYKVGDREAVTVAANDITFTNQSAAGTPGKMSFEIPWVDESGKSLYDFAETVTINYAGKINKYAVDGKAQNTVEVSNNTGKDSLTDDAETTTGEFTIAKVDGSTKALEGAKFRLYDAEKEGNEIPVILENGSYRVADATETGAEIEANQGDDKNLATIKGLDTEETYYLEETFAPSGYNKLETRQSVKAGGEATINVVNQAGSVLPSTGGIGTTIFYIVGGIMVVGAVVVLLAKRRASSTEE